MLFWRNERISATVNTWTENFSENCKKRNEDLGVILPKENRLQVSAFDIGVAPFVPFPEPDLPASVAIFVAPTKPYP